MHLISAYALSTASKIDKPYIYEKFFPIPFQKYITIHNSSGMLSKNYDFYEEVLEMLFSPLKEAGYAIIHIGGKDDQALKGVFDLRGKTDINQSAYILKHSSLHLSNDTFSAHVCGAYKVPVVALYSVSKPEIVKPYWSGKTALIEADRNGNKPSYSPQEFPKTINNIKPEEVAAAVAKLLDLPFKNEIETLYIGANYKQASIEVIPDQVVKVENVAGVLNLRADYHFNEDNIFNQLQIHKCVLVTDKLLNIEKLKAFRQNMPMIVINVDNDIFDFVKLIRKNNLPYGLFTDKIGDEVNALKLKYIDFNPINERKRSSIKDIKENQKISENTLFKTKHIILSKGKIYSSKQHWQAGEAVETMDSPIAKVKLNDEFWSDLDSYYIFNKKE